MVFLRSLTFLPDQMCNSLTSKSLPRGVSCDLYQEKHVQDFPDNLSSNNAACSHGCPNRG